MTFSLYFNDLG